MRTNDLELIKVVKSIFVADNVDPNAPDERCIHYFVGDNIIASNVPKTSGSLSLPQITIDVQIDIDIDDLPAEHGSLLTKIWYDSKDEGVNTKCRMCCGRMITLLNKKQSYIKSINSNCNLRIIDKSSMIILPDEDTRTIFGTVIFDLIFKK